MSRKTVSLLCLLLSVAFFSGVSSAQSVRPELVSYPNLIFYNAQIITADDDHTIVAAVAIRDGKFLALGSDNNILEPSPRFTIPRSSRPPRCVGPGTPKSSGCRREMKPRPTRSAF